MSEPEPAKPEPQQKVKELSTFCKGAIAAGLMLIVLLWGYSIFHLGRIYGVSTERTNFTNDKAAVREAYDLREVGVTIRFTGCEPESVKIERPARPIPDTANFIGHAGLATQKFKRYLADEGSLIILLKDYGEFSYKLPPTSQWPQTGVGPWLELQMVQKNGEVELSVKPYVIREEETPNQGVRLTLYKQIQNAKSFEASISANSKDPFAQSFVRMPNGVYELKQKKSVLDMCDLVVVINGKQHKLPLPLNQRTLYVQINDSNKPEVCYPNPYGKDVVCMSEQTNER